jgi:MFS family permease
MSPKNPMMRVMSLRDFRLLFIGTAISLLGDQFALIAIPWLTLQLTDNPLTLGLVLALEGIPRGAIMLLGGAITDRLSPRIMMIIADVIRFILTCLIAFAIFKGTVEIWMMYAFGLGFGLVSGFEIPAESSIVPFLVDTQDLQVGNSLMQSSAQVAQFVGPTIAGILIGQYSNSFFGIGLAYAIDAVGFAVSAICLWLIHAPDRSPPSESSTGKESIWTSILIGMKYLKTDEALLLIILIIGGLNLLLNGPIIVGIPVLADQRLPGGATAFGLLISAYAGGNLIGYLIAGSTPRPSGNMMRIIFISFMMAFGLVIGALGFIQSTWVDFILLLVLGMGNGYFDIVLFTWMQLRVPIEMIGRIMSIVMFASYGLGPISQIISGAIINWNLNALFFLAGTLVLMLSLWAIFQPALKVLSEGLAAQKA